MCSVRDGQSRWRMPKLSPHALTFLELWLMPQAWHGPSRAPGSPSPSWHRHPTPVTQALDVTGTLSPTGWGQVWLVQMEMAPGQQICALTVPPCN